VTYGYKSLRPFDVSGFVTAYTMPILAPVLFFGWKFGKGTKWLRPEEVDLTWEAPSITAYEEAETEAPVGFFRDIYQSVTGKRKVV
jgi:amino acid transporter